MRYATLAVDGRFYYKHRFMMEQYLHRPLKRYEAVHHINGDKLDNRIENLELITRSKHQTLHKTGKHHKENRVCYVCASNITTMRMPTSTSHTLTPYAHWRHLPNDKANWYCLNCYAKQIRKMQQELGG